jgi:ABC-type branched-subunit amino acid transport system ATPase component
MLYSFEYDQAEGGTPMAALLEGTRVSKTFAGVKALADVDFSLAGGEVVGVIGPNGAGKSTFINVLTGVYRPSTGRVVFDGADVTRLSLAHRARLGIVRTFQGNRVFASLRLDDAIAVAAESPRARRGERWPGDVVTDFGLAAYRGARIADLPYGVQKVLNLALTALTKPRVLLLDEPFAGVHSEDVTRLSAIVERFRQEGVGVALVEHNIEALLRLADRVIVLDSGTQIFAGSPTEARHSDVVRTAYLGGGADAHTGAAQ